MLLKILLVFKFCLLGSTETIKIPLKSINYITMISRLIFIVCETCFAQNYSDQNSNTTVFSALWFCCYFDFILTTKKLFKCEKNNNINIFCI